jgi:hypothetical protein
VFDAFLHGRLSVHISASPHSLTQTDAQALQYLRSFTSRV